MVDEPRTKLQELIDAAGSPVGDLKTPIGKEWRPRIDRAEEKHKEQSYDWEDLRKLYAEPYKEIVLSNGQKVRIKMSLGWSIIKNRNADIYFQNPTSWIQSRTDPRDKRKDRMLRDVAETLHADVRTERNMRRCLDTEGYTGMGVVWTDWQQDDYEEEITIPGDPRLGIEDQTLTHLVVSGQRVQQDFVPPQKMRWDPDGRDWERLTDFKYIIRLYDRSLQDIWEDESLPIQNRKMLVWWFDKQRKEGPSSIASRMRREEENPAFIHVRIAEVWSRAGGEKMIYQIPLGAEFELESYEWPESYSRADQNRGKFPCRVVFLNENVPDEDESQQYPIPTLRLIRGQLEDLNHLQELFLDAATAVIDKYLTIEGLFDQSVFSELMSSHEREVIEIKVDALRQILGPMQDLSHLNLDHLVTRLDTSKDQEMAIAYAAQMDRLERQIYELIGQGPGDRGGISEADSATEAMNIRAQLEKRNQDQVELLASAYDDITELMFLLLVEHQTLPIPYLKSTGFANQKAWDEFRVDEIRGHTLSFRHAIGSNRPPNKQQVKQERRELGAQMLPFTNGPISRESRAVLNFVMEPYDPPSEILDLLEDPARDIAKKLLSIDLAVRERQVDPADPNIVAQQRELTSMLLQAVLTPADMEEVATAGAANEVAPQAGNVAGGLSGGELRAAEAAAGAANIG